MGQKGECTWKIRYDTEPPANNTVGPYKCKYCDGWHMSRRHALTDDWLESWMPRKMQPKTPDPSDKPPAGAPWQEVVKWLRKSR